VRAGSRGSADSRPGRRTTRSAARSTTPRRGPRVTGRAVLLGSLVLLLALTLAGPLRQYVAGRQELAELAAEHDELTRRAADLQAQLDRQSDPAYIAQQARERLTYVLPGDRLVVVVDGETRGEEPGPLTPLPGSTPRLPWYEGLMQSVEVADGDRPAAAEIVRRERGAREGRPVHQQDAVAGAGEEHRGRRAGAAGADHDRVVIRTMDHS
jgi:cell division protein FtsB